MIKLFNFIVVFFLMVGSFLAGKLFAHSSSVVNVYSSKGAPDVLNTLSTVESHKRDEKLLRIVRAARASVDRQIKTLQNK